MAEYEDNLAALQQEPMPEFYLFQTGSDVERYTSYSNSLTFLGHTWTAASITRGGIKQDTQFGAVKLNITTPITPAIEKYIPNQPIVPVNITIYRSHIDYLSQHAIFFKGNIKYVQLRGRLASAQCESKNKFLSEKVPTIIYQAFCNHDIYDDHGTWGCRVDEFSYRRSCQVDSISGSDVTFSFTDGGGAVAIDYFKGGKVNFGTDIRLVTGHDVANVLSLHVPFDSTFETGSEFTVSPGCDGSPDTCINRYNNLLNFTAMPYIPSRNVVIWGFK